jgi:antitoxin component YwqK of YwqJK toxin-antitoxin module
MRSLLILFTLFVFTSCDDASKMGDQKAEKVVERSAEDYVEHYPNGLKKLEGKLVNDQRHGIWTYYYENGMKWSEGRYVHGVRDGYSIVYYENGKKKIEGEYENDLKIGIWKVWEDDGSLVKEINLSEMLSKEDSLKLQMK